MLERLTVRGLGIIDRVELELGPGLTALTGETGAGKSLLVESLKLLGGARASAELVRTGEERLLVDGRFVGVEDAALGELLDELGVEPDEGGGVALRREVLSAGRSRCWLNDTPVTASALQRLAPLLMAIHGQHEQHGLADPTVQRELVDRAGSLAGLVGSVRGAWSAWHEAAAEADRLRRAQSGRRDRLDTIAFQLAEIAGVEPVPGEDQELQSRRGLLRHAVRLAELADAVTRALSDDEDAAVDRLARAGRDLDEMASCGLALGDAPARIEEARVHAEEVVREVQDTVGDLREDPAELEAVESRLHRLESLMLKYGSPLAAVLEHRDQLLAERAELEAVEERVGEAERAAAEALERFDTHAVRLDEARRRAGEELLEDVERVLAKLNMAGTHLSFRWQARSDPSSPLLRDGTPVAFDADGVQACELLIAANPGEEPRPMAKIASGGELSRLHLALRTVLRGRHEGAGLTLLFDEVDTGLGGGTAAALGRLLADVADADQVVVVTHLPQVAAAAGGHLRVLKAHVGDRTVTSVHALEGEERELEIARMLSGDRVTSAAQATARELLGWQ